MVGSSPLISKNDVTFTLTVTKEPKLTLTAITDVTSYKLGDAAQTRTVGYSFDPDSFSDSTNAVTLTVTMGDGNTLIAPIGFVSSTKVITVSSSTYFTPGVYTVKVAATVDGTTS